MKGLIQALIILTVVTFVATVRQQDKVTVLVADNSSSLNNTSSSKFEPVNRPKENQTVTNFITTTGKPVPAKKEESVADIRNIKQVLPVADSNITKIDSNSSEN